MSERTKEESRKGWRLYKKLKGWDKKLVSARNGKSILVANYSKPP